MYIFSYLLSRFSILSTLFKARFRYSSFLSLPTFSGTNWKSTNHLKKTFNLHLLECYFLYISIFLIHYNKSLKWKMKLFMLVKENFLIKYQFWESSCSVSIKFLDPCTICPSFQSWNKNKNFKTIDTYLSYYNTYPGR